jgi:hypothetical protein
MIYKDNTTRHNMMSQDMVASYEDTESVHFQCHPMMLMMIAASLGSPHLVHHAAYFLSIGWFIGGSNLMSTF